MYTGGSLFCISNVNIVEIREKKTGIPVTVENDAKCAALAEIWQGSLKDCQNAIVVICGTAVGGGISEQPLLLQLIREELLKINGMYPWTLPVPEVTSCRFYNDANLIGAVYVHMKAREKKISLDKVNELMELLENRREGKYLRTLLTE